MADETPDLATQIAALPIHEQMRYAATVLDAVNELKERGVGDKWWTGDTLRRQADRFEREDADAEKAAADAEVEALARFICDQNPFVEMRWEGARADRREDYREFARKLIADGWRKAVQP